MKALEEQLSMALTLNQGAWFRSASQLLQGSQVWRTCCRMQALVSLDAPFPVYDVVLQECFLLLFSSAEKDAEVIELQKQLRQQSQKEAASGKSTKALEAQVASA
jgi:hypothetical protein